MTKNLKWSLLLDTYCYMYLSLLPKKKKILLMVKKNCKRVTNYNSSLGKTRAQLTSRSLPKLILEGRPLSQHPVKVLTLALLAYFALFANIIF